MLSSLNMSSIPKPPVFVTHPLCPPHLRNAVEDTIKIFDSAWLLPPQSGEVFQTAKDCLRRLQGYALSRGFTVVTTTLKKNKAQFAYIYHGAKTKNWRSLEDRVKRDIKSEIINRRKKEDTSTYAR
jgi:hypothetical protein